MRRLSVLVRFYTTFRTRDERLALLDFHDTELSVKAQAELLNLNRSSLYYKPVAPSAEDLALKHDIDEIYTA